MAWLTPKLDWTEDDYYNAEDLNRVENNTFEVAQLLGVNLEPVKIDRDYSTIEFNDSLNRVERNIEKISILNLPGLKPLKTTWQAGDPFNFRDAIRLETNAAILYPVLIKNRANTRYCGSLICGEDVI